MNGKEYITSFTDNGFVPPDAEQQAWIEKGFNDTSSLLWSKIVGLYSGEVHFLTDELAPSVVVEARESINDRRERKRLIKVGSEVVGATMRKIGMRETDKIFIERLPDDLSADMTAEELTVLLEDDQLMLQAELADYSEGALCLAVDKISRKGQKHDLCNIEIAQEIKEALKVTRPDLHNVLKPRRGVVTIERDFSVNRTGGFETLENFRVAVSRKGKHLRQWVSTTNEWHDPIHILCAMVTEIETLIALQEWVVERRLPYIPVSAPFEFERGNLVDKSEGKNMRADILLCCLDPDKNEIIPVQVKNTISQSIRAKYDPNVVLVSPRHLGLETTENCIVKTKGRARTGIKTIVKYGTIADSYMAVRSGQRKNIKPSKKSIEEFSKALQPAFDYFDRAIKTTGR